MRRGRHPSTGPLPREAHSTSLSGATWPADELQRGMDGEGSRFCHIPPPGLTVDPDARTFSIEQATIVAVQHFLGRGPEVESSGGEG